MKVLYPIVIFILFCISSVSSQNTGAIRISEVFYSSSGNDWVELKYSSPDHCTYDISSLFVTMYYGTNEKLSNDPVTLYSYDRSETPYDDRYAVVYLTSDNTDETDLTGDTNRNHILEIYCRNNSSSLWNDEAVVAIDTNDSPEDGMIDIVFYSSLEGTFSSNVSGYVNDAVNTGGWNITGSDIRSSSVLISSTSKNVSIIRNSPVDTNTADDFKITFFTTPGSDNIFKSVYKKNKKIFTPPSGKIIFSCSSRLQKLDVTLFYQAEIQAKIFTSSGLLVSKSEKQNFKSPGQYSLYLHSEKKIIPGLYVMIIEAYNSQNKINQKEKFITVMTK
ncbi:MAG: hypothetical protein JW982_09820 [Spirochaetes bacterium]|nr:hypothetical protein [Spirochaetota bacterium]